jgi:phage shock protein PspC (stress-responsive transcriptional regulator)
MHQTGEQAFYRGNDRIIGGVCSGLAAGFHINALWVRIAFVLLAFLQGIGLFIYIVLWLVMPERIEGEAGPRSGFESMAADLRRVSRELQAQFGGLVGSRRAAPPADQGGAAASTATSESVASPVPVGARRNQSLLLGVVLVVLGAILFGANTGLVSWNVMWPAAVIVIGVVLLVRTLERKT